MLNEKERIEFSNAIKKLEHKAELTRHMHSIGAKRLEWKINFITYATVLLSISVAFFSIVNPDLIGIESSNLIWISRVVGLSGILIFTFTVIDKILGLNNKKAAHDQSIRLLTDFIRKCNQFRHYGLDSIDFIEANKIVNDNREEYSTISRAIPDSGISDEEFVIEKQIFSIKRELSSKIDDNSLVDNSEGLRKIRELRKDERKIRFLNMLKL